MTKRIQVSGRLGGSNRETDMLRLDDLAKEHGLSFTTSGAAWFFDFDVQTFRARSLGQALAFAEGFDRAMKEKSRKKR
jgi:hypothetical protein